MGSEMCIRDRCWVVFLHNECDAGARRQACSQHGLASRAKNGPKKGPALGSPGTTPRTSKKAAKPRATTSHLTLSCGANRSQFPRLIGAVCRPPPQRLPTPAPGASEAISETLLKRHARARPWQRTTPWTAPAVMMMRRRRSGGGSGTTQSILSLIHI